MAGETEMAADYTNFPPLTPILLLFHVRFSLLFLSWGHRFGFGIEMAGETEMSGETEMAAENNIHPQSPIFVLQHLLFSLNFLSSR